MIAKQLPEGSCFSCLFFVFFQYVNPISNKFRIYFAKKLARVYTLEAIYFIIVAV